MPEERLIYVYEDEENRVCYVGLTKNLRMRHKTHQCVKSNGKYGNLKQYFIDKGKKLPNPKVLECCLKTKEDAQDREHYWLMKYIEDGWKPINKAKTGKGVSSLGSVVEARTEEEWRTICETHAKECKNRAEFGYKHPGSYYYTLYNKKEWLDEFFGKNKKKPRNYWTYSRVIMAAKKCTGRNDFFSKFPRAHDIAVKNGFIDELFGIQKVKHKPKKAERVQNREKILKLYNKNKSIRENAKTIGIPKTTLSRIVKQLKLN